MDWLLGLDTHPLILLGLFLVVWVYRKLCRRKESRLPAIPLGLIQFSLVLFLLIPLLGQIENPTPASVADVAATIALCLGIARAVVYFIVDYLFAQRRKIKIPSITSDLVLAVIWFFIIMVILRQKLNFDLTSLITTSAILTAVIGFALQDTLGNLFAGLAIQAEQPYQLGDWVKLSDYTGRVDGISWKSTKITTTSRQTIYIPNSVISKSAIFNYSQPTPEYIASLEIGISYDHPPNLVKRTLLDVMSQHANIIKSPQSEVQVKQYSDSAITYLLRFRINSYSLENPIKSDLLTSIWYRFRREGIRIPYPIRTLLQAEPSSKEVSLSATQQILDELALFQPLGEEARKILGTRLRTQLYGPQEEIVRQGTSGDSLYIITRGQCRIYLSVDNGPVQQIATLGPGDFFGEMSLLTGAPRAATVVAEEETLCLKISKDDVKDILLSKPQIANELSVVLAQRQAMIEGVGAEEHNATKESRAQKMLVKIWDFFKN